MKPFKFWTLTLSLMTVATVLFSRTSFAEPTAKAKRIAQKIVAQKVVIRLGKPYRAELKKEKPQAKPGELTITIHCHADCNLPGEDANFQYLQWRNSVQFGKLGRQ